MTNYNILPFLRDPSSANFGLLLRLQQKNNQALRLGLGFALNNNSYETSKNFGQSIDVAVGYEWQKNKNKLVVYYGSEVRGFFSNYTSENSYTTANPDMSKQTFKIKQYTATAAGFFGVRWFIIPQLSLSVESGFQYTYSYSQNKNKSYYFNSPSTESQHKNTSHSINFIPVRAIYIGYHF